MHELSLHPSAPKSSLLDLEEEIAQLERLLAERRCELADLQEEFRSFKARYTQVVGSRLAELAEVEREIKEAEKHLFGLEDAGDEEEFDEPTETAAPHASSGKTALRRLFWSVARLFHPDHAADDEEARRRHAVMSEASRAYREGDVESLHTLLGDEQLQFFCAGGYEQEEEETRAHLLVRLKEELRTVEFGIRRIEQDGLYRLKLNADEEALAGRDAVTLEASRIERQITKARRRLAHLSPHNQA